MAFNIVHECDRHADGQEKLQICSAAQW